MQEDANALLKGMLGIKNLEGGMKGESDKKMKPKGQRSANVPKSQSIHPKPGKANTSNLTNAKSSKGKRGGGKKNISDGNITAAAEDDTNNEENSTKLTITNSLAVKKKRNKKRDSQNGNEDDGETKKTPQLKETEKFNSEKQNANVYAWSAFQSSPDPSALPDIGGLFLASENSEAKEGEEAVVAKEGVDLGSSIELESSLTFGPPSDQIRSSLVNSILSKRETRVNAGEALLKSLTSPNRQASPAAPMPPLHEQFRTAESLEAEMLSPTLQPTEKPIVDQASLPNINLMDTTPVTAAISDGQCDHAEKGLDEVKSDDAELSIGEAMAPEKAVSPNPAEQPEHPTIKKEYPDAISQLMNPGGFGGGGYGVPHPTLQQYAPHHFPLHYGPPPPTYQGQYGPPYPMPPPQPHMPHPYHHMQPHVRPGYTTVHIRVPRALLPGNTMIVDGMQIPVPPGVPPGAIIPVNVPIPMSHQYSHQYYGPPPHPPPLYHGGYHHHTVPPHAPGQHPLMTQTPMQQIPPPQTQSHCQEPESNIQPQPPSWAARVAGGSPSQSGTADSYSSTKKGETDGTRQVEPTS